MTNEDAKAYFIDSNERIISVAKDENRYNYETQQIEDVFMRRDFEAKELAIKALEQQPCEDCVSREAVQDLISKWLSDYLLDETREALETINYKVGDMPSVTPERPKGKWIKVDDEEPIAYDCSECNAMVTKKYKYCPNCGSYNGGGEDEVSD